MRSFEEAATNFSEETRTERCLAVVCAPFLLSGETEYLARFSDVVLMVVQSGVTRREELQTVTDVLQKMPVKLAGFLLTSLKLTYVNAREAERLRTLDERARRQLKQDARISRLIGKDPRAKSSRSVNDAGQIAD